MNLLSQIAKQFRDVHFGGNWTAVNLKDTLAGITWQQATTKIDSFNTVAALVFHINYYVGGMLQYIQQGELTIRDKYSFNHPPIASEEDWNKLLDKTWTEAESFASMLEQLPETKLDEIFFDEKYGNYYRNFHGLIEHTHYHLGQIVLIKKMIAKARQ